MSKSMRSSTTKRVMKAKLFKGRDVVRCCFCKRQLYMNDATLEHIVPLSEGGRWAQENLALSCAPCNHERGSEDFETFRTRKRANYGRKQRSSLRSIEESRQEDRGGGSVG